ncbi:MAG: ABC transporter permease [Chloroflexi bacterium]|nr:ABC transporter permease [Chloroflexota bacterium]MCL5275153.1 ABC transporter permease [Chloroflexota bacterium]
MFRENLRVALRALAANKLRSVLTTLGIIIGVAAVIALVAAGNGVRQYINQQFEAQGANLVYVFPARIDIQGGANRSGFLGGNPSGRSGIAASLTEADAAALNDRNLVPDASAVVPVVSGGARAYSGQHKYQARVRGTSPDYRYLNNWNTRYGDWFNEADYVGRSRVALLGSYAYAQLFPDGGDPDGYEVRLNDVSFKIVGVLQERSGGVAGSDDDTIIIPLTTARDRLFPSRNAKGQSLVGIILVQAVNKDRVDAVAQQVTELLRQRHNIEFQGEDDFSVATQQDLQNTVGAVTGVLTIFLAAIAAISLLVGGIGIMNIMLVSVTERTREIGLRKAIGAKSSVILVQFLLESVFLSLLGGFIGIGLGWGMASLVALASNNQFQALVTPDAVALAVGFSILVGVVFGVYPAARAARLNPIDALRYE